MKPAIFLDRDGVINRAIVRNGKPYAPQCLAELEIMPGVKDAFNKLKVSGYLLIVITNQPDVARGTIEKQVVEDMNDYLGRHLPIEEFKTCYHDDVDNCFCRKPQPGALFSAAKKHGIDLKKSYMVGDRWKDIEAGRRAGCKTIFIDNGYSELQPVNFDFRVQNVFNAALIILGENDEKHTRFSS